MKPPEASQIVATLPDEADLQTEIAAEITLFDNDFTKIQRDGARLLNHEKAVLRSYLIWKLHIRKRMDELGVTET